jgi:hypothetical protein
MTEDHYIASLQHSNEALREQLRQVRAELRETQAAVERVRQVCHGWTYARSDAIAYRLGRESALKAVLRALDEDDQ